ncbi:MAG: protease inhibitor I42 family protein [Candidatus Udaeobacter sp.]
MAEYIFSEKDNGASVEVQCGAKITIELKENPTTGYRWRISSIDEVFLQPECDEFLPPDQTTPGAGGLRRFFFRAKSAGSTALTLISKRAWQRDDQAVNTFRLAIRILK